MPRLSSGRLGSILARLGSIRLSAMSEPGGRFVSIDLTSRAALFVHSRKGDIALHSPATLNLKSRS